MKQVSRHLQTLIAVALLLAAAGPAVSPLDLRDAPEGWSSTLVMSVMRHTPLLARQLAAQGPTELCGECEDLENHECVSLNMETPCHQWFSHRFPEPHDRGQDIHTSVMDLGLGTCEDEHPACGGLTAGFLAALTWLIESTDVAALEHLLSRSAPMVWAAVDMDRSTIRVLRVPCEPRVAGSVFTVEAEIPVAAEALGTWMAAANGISALATIHPSPRPVDGSTAP